MKTQILNHNKIMGVGGMGVMHIPYLDKAASHSRAVELLKAK